MRGDDYWLGCWGDIMPVTPTYPGIYIEELPSLTHSVTPAPTSVTVFVGYTHPFKTKTFKQAVEIFSFADYQANFGGFFDLDDWLPDYTGNAVNQFFLNGGADAWVVGLQPSEFVNGLGVAVDDQGTPVAAGGTGATFSAATLVVDVSAVGAAAGSATVTLTALEPGGTDPNGVQTGTPTTIEIVNPRHSASGVQDFDIADIIIIHGITVETYRGLSAANLVATLNDQSQLVSAAATTGTAASFTLVPSPGEKLAYAAPLPPSSGANSATLFNPAVDFATANVFQTGGSLDVDVKIFNLMVLPGVSPVNNEQSAVLSDALVFCEGKRAFFIMDAPPNATTSDVSPPPTGQPLGTPSPVTMDAFMNNHAPGQAPPPVSQNGAIYFPYLQITNPVNPSQTINSPPSGFVAGIFAREDLNYSVGKAPAGLETTLQETSGVVPWGRMTDMQQGVLNKSDGVNCLREFPGLGPPVVFGARTLVATNNAYQQWWYVPVRRTALFLEDSLYGSLGWAVFQPNAQPLWDALTQEVEAFMMSLFRQGNYFQGNTPTEAFLVQCDSNTTTQQDIDLGQVNILVGFAPLKPAEFVIIKITQLAGQTQT
jgi:phage tail sheath protein FI